MFDAQWRRSGRYPEVLVNELADRVRDVLNSQEVGTVVLADVGDACNVWMIDGRHYPSFTLTAGHNFRRCQVQMQHLERDITFKVGIVCVIDRTLAAGCQARDLPLLSDHLCWRNCHDFSVPDAQACHSDLNVP